MHFEREWKATDSYHLGKTTLTLFLDFFSFLTTYFRTPFSMRQLDSSTSEMIISVVPYLSTRHEEYIKERFNICVTHAGK